MPPRKKTPETLLANYRRKRDFTRTAEPSGSEKTPAAKTGSLIYMIQKHDATRLHYDFRLELDGVMKSWAVTRGPSLNPADKRLAVHVEDHPVSYATFEGTIPEGEYGGGTVMLWDRGHWEPVGDPREGYRKGNLKFRLLGERLQGEWALIRMHGHRKGDGGRDNWLLIKHRNDLAESQGDAMIERHMTSIATGRHMEEIAAGDNVLGKPKVKRAASQRRAKMKLRTKAVSGSDALPDFVELQLATLVDVPPKGEEWRHEIKFDGYRLLARIDGGEVQMMTRNRQDWTHRFQSLADDLARLGIERALIDGEAAVHNAAGATSFSELQNALTAKDDRQLHFYAFDLLHLNGHDLRKNPLIERKQMLRLLLPENHARLHYSEDFSVSGDEMYRHACSIALEGIISKRADRPYASGRGLDWVKSKCLHEQEFMIGGFTEQPKHPGRLAALLIGYREDEQWRFAGKVGTGFTQASGAALMKRLKTLRIDAPAFAGKIPSHQKRGAIWVEPRLVAQLRFTEWTEDGMLRHPAFLGLREDKEATSVTRERKAPTPKKRPTPTISSLPRSSKGLELMGVTITHPDKIVYPESGITKGMIAAYYAGIAERLLPHVAGRPLSLLRCPSGATGTCFFQRHAGEGLSEHVRTMKVADSNEREAYLYIEDEAGLMALAQMGALELHVWGATAKTADRPDRLVFDFDPDSGVPWKNVKKAAVDLRKLLDGLGLQTFLKTTGGKGLHVVAPIRPGPSWDEVKECTRKISEGMEEAMPDRFTTNIRKAARKGKILIDYFRNDHSASSVAPYSPRARPGAPVSLPIGWDELPRLGSSARYTVENLTARLSRKPDDPWKDFFAVK